MLLSDKEYRRRLEVVAEQLKSAADIVDIRGSDIGQFIQAKNESRSLEISQCEDGVWIEFRQGNDEPIKETAVSSYNDCRELRVRAVLKRPFPEA